IRYLLTLDEHAKVRFHTGSFWRGFVVCVYEGDQAPHSDGIRYVVVAAAWDKHAMHVLTNKEEGSKRNNAPLQPQYSSSILDENANYMNIMSMNGGIGFTFMQLEELKLQALIYNYIEAGLPVPSHLILPIWNSVLASFTGSGCDHSLHDNYKNTMEAEPGRCKRTDGKKWRCSKEVVSGHKYCERHLHRGVKAIDRVSTIKSKSKVSGKCNSPKSRWVLMNERVLSPQHVTQYNPITGEVRKESEKAAVVKENSIVSKSKVAAIVSEKSTVVKESAIKSIEKLTVVKERDVTSKVGKSNVSAVVIEKSAVDEKDNLKVSKVSDKSNKVAVVAPVIEKVPVATESDKETKPVIVADVKAPVVTVVDSVVEKDNPKVTSKVSNESVNAPVVKESVKKSVKVSSVVADKPSSVFADKDDLVVKKSVKASSVVADKPSSVVMDKVDVVKDNINVVADKASDALKNKPTEKGKKLVVGDKIEVTPSKIHDMLGVPFGGYLLFDLDEREADHEFADGLKGQISLDVVRCLREDSVIFDIDWCRQELEFKDHVVGLLDLHNKWNKAEVQEFESFISFLKTFEKEDLIKKVKENLSLICAKRVMLEDYMRKASLKCPGDGKFVSLHKKYVNLFKDPISFVDDGNGDNVGNDDDENGDDDGGNVDNDVNDCDGNGDEEDVNEGDKDPNGSNPSFGFSKISLEDFGNDSNPTEKDNF
nr:growth-regulating factor 10-like [Tanacetum cinerariifolium]